VNCTLPQQAAAIYSKPHLVTLVAAGSHTLSLWLLQGATPCHSDCCREPHLVTLVAAGSHTLSLWLLQGTTPCHSGCCREPHLVTLGSHSLSQLAAASLTWPHWFATVSHILLHGCCSGLTLLGHHRN